MERTDKGYRLSSGREIAATVVGLGILHDERWCIGAGYSSELFGATGRGDTSAEPGEHPERWTADERRELADFMIAQWTTFRASLR